MTTVLTSNLVRDDVADATTDATAASSAASPATTPTSNPSRLWAVSGLAAAVTGIAAIAATAGTAAVYDPAISGDADKILDAMLDARVASTTFHVLAATSAMLLVPFAAGLYRRLRTGLPTDSLLPAIAAIGVAITSVVLVMGSGLDTEFGFGLPPKGFVVAENVAFYSHWVGTIPYLWTGVGLAGLATFVAAVKHRSVPRWMGVVGLVFGGLTVLTGVSPLEYMAGMVGPIWLLVTAIGFLVGDRTHRRR